MRYIGLFVLSLTIAGSPQALSQTQIPLNTVPSRILGHPNPEITSNIASANPNLVEGRELYAPWAVALDASVSPPIIYVSDLGNNRILAWKDAVGFSNGQKADLVIGQKDFFGTFPQGPGQTGLNNPSGLTVDSKGSLWVVDTGNNRVLRYPQPFSQTSTLVFPDMVIGQPNLSSRTPNFNGQVDKQGISLPVGAAIAFDAAGNLWLTDTGNRRVLRFKAADLVSGNAPSADLEIGQLDFFTTQPNLAAQNYLTGNQFFVPVSLAFDPSGRLYVGDTENSIARVLVFQPPFTSGMSAARMMGVPGKDQTLTPQQQDATVFGSPQAIFFLPNNGGLGVVDSASSRILLFDPFEKWPDAVAQFSPQARAVFGQPDFHNRNRNGGPSPNWAPPPTRVSINQAVAAVFYGDELYVADAANNRVVVFSYVNGGLSPAARVLGQDSFITGSPNLIEGREFQFLAQTAGGLAADAGIAIDNSGDTPRLYVADTFNHRVLGFSDLRKARAGAQADLVIGQPDFATGVCNYQSGAQSGNPDAPTPSSLCGPRAIAVDSNGDLYVADTLNARVVRFPAPFAQPGPMPKADFVLGQSGLFGKITDPSANTMAAPSGLAFTGKNGLLVSDQVHHRVLYFPMTNGKFDTSQSGMAAAKVFGQPDFVTITPGSSDGNLNGPRQIACDNNGRVYVADSGNNRILIFADPASPQTPAAGARAALALTAGFNGPRGVYVNPSTEDIWVADSNNLRVRKCPRFDLLFFGATCTGSDFPQVSNVLAVAQDQFGDLIVADATSRLAFFYPGLQGVNGATLLPNMNLSPGMFASLCSAGSNCDPGKKLAQFGSVATDYTKAPAQLPLPGSLGDVQVTVNGTVAPLYSVSPDQINFQVPWESPTTGTAAVEVTQVSTGRLFAAGPVPMDIASPGLLTTDFTSVPRVALVYNEDGSQNTTTNPAKRGSTITLYATGLGNISSPPGDGAPPEGTVAMDTTPRVFLNQLPVDSIQLAPGDPSDRSFIQFAGLAPASPGIWMIKMKIPFGVPPGLQTPILVVSSDKPSVTPGSFLTVFSVAQ